MTFATQAGAATRLELAPKPRFRRCLSPDERRAARALLLSRASAEGWTTHELAQVLRLSVRTIQSELSFARSIESAARHYQAAADD